jgi:hypothetical protein
MSKTLEDIKDVLRKHGLGTALKLCTTQPEFDRELEKVIQDAEDQFFALGTEVEKEADGTLNPADLD